MSSRVAAKFNFEINDWDRVGASDFLGENTIDLAALEPLEATEQTLPVMLNGKQEGTLTIRMLFSPDSKSALHDGR